MRAREESGVALMRYGMLFCLLLAVLTAVLPLAAKPARAGDKFVAVIITGDLPRYQQAHDSFMKILEA
ncbi:MAG TPA: hypothetical protein VKA48_07055, partial [Gammaproteobacteria bacterium]|nr:hypothetical protein [Gammaproteobacteria bacterium]